MVCLVIFFVVMFLDSGNNLYYSVHTLILLTLEEPFWYHVYSHLVCSIDLHTAASRILILAYCLCQFLELLYMFHSHISLLQPVILYN
jgi:hypothetical protein